MITELRLANFGVVAQAELALGPGLTAVTGETGAGKTMIVSGLGMLLGQRAESGTVRHGSDQASVEGRFQVDSDEVHAVEELGGEVEEGELIALRRISATGRSRAVLGGAAVPVSSLSKVLNELATIHGQSEQVRLGSTSRQREILDEFAQPADLPNYRNWYQEHQSLTAEHDRLKAEASERQREIDMLRFGLGEIAEIAPEPGEDESLAAEATRLMDADELRNMATSAQFVLSGSETDFDQPNVVAMLGEVRSLLQRLSERDQTASQLASQATEASYLISDLAQEVASYATDLVTDPLRLEVVTERRAALAGLERKYGSDIAKVLEWAGQAEQRLTELEGSDERIEQLASRLTELDQLLTQSARRITEARTEAADRFATQVQEELAGLAMPHARLKFEITSIERGPQGADRVELLFSANPGSTPASLGKVASGGELSRIRLALEVVLAGSDHTFIFDEVDAGVGGAVGLEIGRRLQRLAQSSQVLVVTHLAQVAAFADAHFVVSKSSDGEVTTADVHQLEPSERAGELARMMGGDGDSTSGLKHAQDLLKRAQRKSGS